MVLLTSGSSGSRSESAGAAGAGIGAGAAEAGAVTGDTTSVFRRLSFPVFAVSQSLETGEPDPLYFVLNVS